MISVQPPPSAATAQPACLQSANLNGYQTKLHPWCIVRLLPKMQRIVVGRFRKGNDADDHARSLRQLIPQGRFVVIFDPGDPIGSSQSS
ncbi:MAG: hypothetical protein ACFB2W_16475 [Leptolyngbyaceae cyanobacterium]